MRRRLSLARIALVGYFAVVLVVGLLPDAAGISHPALVSALAFSPSDLVAGRLWLLPLSAVVVDGDAGVQFAVLAPAAIALSAVVGARGFWRVAILAHVGSTLIAYAILGLLDVAEPPLVGDLFSDPDYGVSCVWVGCIGALAVVTARTRGRTHVKVALGATVAVPIVAVVAAGFVTAAGTLDIASVEHLLAFLLGALAGWMTARPSEPPPHPPLIAEAHRDGRRSQDLSAGRHSIPSRGQDDDRSPHLPAVR